MPKRGRPHTSEPGGAAEAAFDIGDAENGEAEPEEKGPLRRCVVTRASFRRETMLRFVIGPGEIVVPDIAAKLPGRGIWLSARRDVVDTARTKGAFARVARRKVTVPAELTSIVETALARRVGEHLGFARRAGQAVCGFAKAREMIQSGRCGIVVQATDGSPEECSRLLSGASELKVVAPFDAASLGAVFGRDHIVHVAVAGGRLAEAIAVEAERLAGFFDPRADGSASELRRAGA